MRPIGSILCGLILLGGASSAFAEEPAGGAPAMAGKSTQQLTLPKGKLVIDAFLDINLSTDLAFDPVSISPDIWYGVNDDITVGLVHSTPGATGFISGLGNSLCFGDLCGGVYDNVGLDARFRIKSPWVVDAGLFFSDFADELGVTAKLGISGRWTFNKIALEIQPAFYLALAPDTAETLAVPVTLGYAASPKLQVGIQTGLILPFENTSEALQIPLSLMARFKVNPKASLGLAFSFLSIDEGADLRTLTLGVSYAL